LAVVEEIDGTWVMKAGTIHIGLHKTGAAYPDQQQKPFQIDSNTKLVFKTT
jgi:hypothetical protein